MITIVSNISTPAPSTIKQQLVFYASPAVYYKRDTSLVKAVLDLTVGETTYGFTSIELVSKAPSVANLIASAALEDLTTTSKISTTTSLNTSIAVSVTSTSLNITSGAAASITPILNSITIFNSTSTAIAAVFTNSSTSILSSTSSSSIVTPLDTTSASPVASVDPSVANTTSSSSSSVSSIFSTIPTPTIQYVSSNVPINSSTNTSTESNSNSVYKVTTTNVYGSTIVVNANGDSQSISTPSSIYKIYTTDKSTTSCHTSIDKNGMSTVVTMMTSVWETVTCTETKCLYRSDEHISTTGYTLELTKSIDSSFTNSGVSTENISIATQSIVSSAEDKALAIKISGLSSLLGLLIMFI